MNRCFPFPGRSSAIFLLSIPLLALRGSAQDTAWSSLKDPAFGGLNRVFALTVDRDGRVFGLDQGRAEVLAWSADLNFVTTLGRRGSGPGEFANPWNLGLSGDTLWVVDLGNDRITGIHKLTGEALGQIVGARSWRLIPGSGPTAPLCVTNSGRVLAAKEDLGGPVVNLYLVGREWPPKIDEVAEVDFTDRDFPIRLPGQPNLLVVRNPFASSQLFKVDPQCSTLALITRSSQGAHNPTVSIRSLDGSGETEEVVPLEPSRMNRSDIARWVEASGMAEEFTEAGFFENQDQALRAIVEQFGTPRFAPSVPNWGRGILEESVFVASSGAVFLAGWTTESTVQWLEVRPGKVRKISLPDGLKVVSIDDRWVWLQKFDEYDRPTVFRIPLEEG